MTSRSWFNSFLFLALSSTVALCWIVKERDVSRPNYDFLPPESELRKCPLS